ncbi:MAG: hypothetical protein ACRYGF_04710 [Janthinobacterium lividum]
MRIVFAFLLCLLAAQAHGSVSLLMEEPFGTFGAFNPTGHAAVYLSGVCAEEPTRLRLCRAGEQGVVISRYHRVSGYDWIAVPLIPYLYATENLSDKPDSITPALEADLRDRYRRQYLQDIAPNGPDGGTPAGEWIQLVGASYDRKIYVFEMPTSHEQDRMLVAKLNDGRNKSHFNLFYRNCADFSRSVLRTLYPDTIPRNSIADFGLTTPKHLARSMVKISEKRPELGIRMFQIPQVPGTTARSHHVDGIAESLVRSKKYFLPLAFLSPTTAATLVAAYVGTGRFSVQKDVPIMPQLLEPETPVLLLESDGIAIGSFSEAAMGITSACSVPPSSHEVETLRGGSD